MKIFHFKSMHIIFPTLYVKAFGTCTGKPAEAINGMKWYREQMMIISYFLNLKLSFPSIMYTLTFTLHKRKLKMMKKWNENENRKNDVRKQKKKKKKKKEKLKNKMKKNMKLIIELSCFPCSSSFLFFFYIFHFAGDRNASYFHICPSEYNHHHLKYHHFSRNT